MKCTKDQPPGYLSFALYINNIELFILAAMKKSHLH
jgi:hypothetical protein